MSSRSLDIESPMALLLAMHHPWEFQKISIETFRSFLLDFTLWLLHQKMCSFSRHWFRFQNITDFRRFRLKPSEVLHFLTPNQRPEKKQHFFSLITSFWAQIFQWYILVFFGCCCCCSPCSSGGCWWYPCHGSHLIGECATHCCVGISSSKGVGRSYWQDYVFVGAWNEKGRSILPKTIWFWVGTEYLAHSLPILPSSAGAWPSLCSHCSSGPRKWWPRSGAVAKFGGT